MNDPAKGAQERPEVIVGGLVEHAQEHVTRYIRNWCLENNSQVHFAATITMLLHMRKYNYSQLLKDPASIWQEIRSNENIQFFVMGGTTDMYFRLAVDDGLLDEYLHKPIAKAYGWLATGQHVDSVIKDRCLNRDALTALMRSDPWVTFLLVMQQTVFPVPAE